MRRLLLVALVLAFNLPVAARLRVAAFRADLTPPPGQPLIWTTPLERVEDPLWAKGVLLEDGSRRSVLCAIDWCALSNSARDLFLSSIAAAAGTTPDRVALHTVHQHTAPYVDGDAYKLLSSLASPPLRMSERFLEAAADRLAAAVRKAAGELQPFDSIGTGQAVVERVASTRRLAGEDGTIVVRYSTGGRDPAMASAPEGLIDPVLRTITFARGTKPIARIHYYATHPQTFCCDGRASADFVGAAREALEETEGGVFQVYFTGCAGDVTAGKYNDGTPAARRDLAARLLAGMKASVAASRFQAADSLRWRSVELTLPSVPAQIPLEDSAHQTPDRLYRGAIAAAFAARKAPLAASSLRIGNIWLVHLPGEPMLEFQLFAQRLKPDGFVAVAGYGDLSPGYLCTDRSFTEGGYEPSASNAGPGTEAAVKNAIQRLLDE